MDRLLPGRIGRWSAWS